MGGGGRGMGFETESDGQGRDEKRKGRLSAAHGLPSHASSSRLFSISVHFHFFLRSFLSLSLLMTGLLLSYFWLQSTLAVLYNSRECESSAGGGHRKHMDSFLFGNDSMCSSPSILSPTHLSDISFRHLFLPY